MNRFFLLLPLVAGCSSLSIVGHYDLVEATDGPITLTYPVTVASDDVVMTTETMLTLGRDGKSRAGELVTFYTTDDGDEIIEEAWYQPVDVMKVGRGYHLFAYPNDEADDSLKESDPWAADCVFKKKVLTCIDDFGDTYLFAKI